MSNQPRTHNAANELTEINAASTYVAEDTAGNMTSRPRSPAPAPSQFDGLGRRIQRVAGSDNSDYYYNDQWQLLEERKNGDADPLHQCTRQAKN